MECYITYTIKGFYALNSENKLICEKLFPENEIINRLAEIDDKQIVMEEKEIIEELSADYDDIIIESNKRLSDYGNDKLIIKTPNQAGEYLRSNYNEFGLDDKKISEIYQRLAIYKIKKESASEDKHLIQAINSIDEIDETISKLIERIREWYALYFPEMDIIKNNETYIKLISQNKTKENIIEAKPEAFPNNVLDLEDDINPQDLERGFAYAKDLIGGLEMLRTFSQGVTIFGSARVDENNKYYQATRELGQKLAQNGHTVITGGGPGIMEAANRGAYEYGGRSIGLNITLDHEQFPNPYLTDVLEFRYFFARKVMLSMASKAYVFMPGGFGTMDEMTEIVILMQEHKMPKMPVFLFGKSYWRPLEKFYRTRLLADKMIKADDLKIMRLTDDVDEIVAAANKIGHARVDENIYDTIKKAQK